MLMGNTELERIATRPTQADWGEAAEITNAWGTVSARPVNDTDFYLAQTCTIPAWQPTSAVYASTESLPVFPNDFANLSPRAEKILDRLANDLEGVTNTVDRSRIIYELFLKLEWQPLADKNAPSPYDADEMLWSPRGNCCNVTNLLYALHVYFDVPCEIIYKEGGQGHVFMRVRDASGRAIEVDGTLLEKGFDANITGNKTVIDEAIFASRFYTNQGIAYSKGSVGTPDMESAKRSYKNALLFRPDHPVARLNLAILYLTDENSTVDDKAQAGVLLQSLENDGVQTGGTLYLRGLYSLKVENDPDMARIYFEKVLLACDDSYTYNDLAEQWLSEI